MTSQLDLQTIPIHILSNISQSKGNQTMKFGHLIEHNKMNIFLQKLCENESVRLVPDLFFIFLKKLYIRWKQVDCTLVAIALMSIALNLQCNKNKMCKTLEYWSRHMLNFHFSENGLGQVSPTHFAYDFSKNIFLMLQSINWPNFIVWWSLLLKTLGNMCIKIVC